MSATFLNEKAAEAREEKGEAERSGEDVDIEVPKDMQGCGSYFSHALFPRLFNGK